MLAAELNCLGPRSLASRRIWKQGFLGNLILRPLFSFPLGTEMFHFPRYTLWLLAKVTSSSLVGFPHSEISGSKVATHLPEAYRSYATSFIAS